LNSSSSSCLKASKLAIQGAKNPYPSPTRTVPAMLKPSHIPNKAGKATKRATLRGISNLSVLQIPNIAKINIKS
jgi:hypothetical protein